MEDPTKGSKELPFLCPRMIRRHQRDMGDTKRHLKASALVLVCPGCDSDMLFPRRPTPASSSASLACKQTTVYHPWAVHIPGHGVEGGCDIEGGGHGTCKGAHQLLHVGSRGLHFAPQLVVQ